MDFIHFESEITQHEEEFHEEEEEEENEQEQRSSFIEDESIIENSPSFYRGVDKSPSNVDLSYEQAMALLYSSDDGDFSNFVRSNGLYPEREVEFDESKMVESRFKRFRKSLKQKGEKNKDRFMDAVLWGVYSKLKLPEKDLDCKQEKLEKVLGEEFVSKLTEIKEEIHLDIDLMSFERKMNLVNDLIFEKNMFLRLFENKKSLGICSERDTIKTSCKKRSRPVLSVVLTALT